MPHTDEMRRGRYFIIEPRCFFDSYTCYCAAALFLIASPPSVTGIAARGRDKLVTRRLTPKSIGVLMVRRRRSKNVLLDGTNAVGPGGIGVVIKQGTVRRFLQVGFYNGCGCICLVNAGQYKILLDGFRVKIPCLVINRMRSFNRPEQDGNGSSAEDFQRRSTSRFCGTCIVFFNDSPDDL